MKNMEKLLDKLATIQELIADRAESLCRNENTSVKELALCAKIVKEIFGTIAKYTAQSTEIRQEISRLTNTDKNNTPLIQNVYDIATLEDVLQDARERFKDDLHLIEHHQNPIDVIKKAHAYVDKVLATPPQDGT